MKFKIKRFLKRNFKRILRCIIIFGVLCTFTVSCFATQYNDFSTFMQGANAEGYRYDQEGFLVNTFPAEDMGNYDTIFIRSPGAGYGGTLDTYWFGGIELRYTNGTNFMKSYVKGDYIYLQQQLYISTIQSYDITGTLGDFRLDVNKTFISIYTTDEYGVTSVGRYAGRTFVKSITYDEWGDDLGGHYKSMLIDITLKQPLPDDGSEIYGITYQFPSMFAGDSIYFDLQPSNSSSVVFDVGDPSTMATYPDFGGNATLEEEQAITTQLRNQAVNAITGGWATVVTSTDTFLGHPFVYKGITGASNLIDDILGNTFIRNLLWVSLSLGISVFVLNVGTGILTRSVKKGD